ncbi:MAG: hypothetical protein OHK0052_09340 [Anaerolineales bacterium]
MSIHVLIITPIPGFGEFLQESLAHSNQGYQAHLAKTAQQACALIKVQPMQIAIIDHEINDMPLPQLVENLRAAQPRIKLVLMPPENQTQQATFSSLGFDDYLNKPFYLLDLLETIKHLLPADRVLSRNTIPSENFLRNTRPRREISTPLWLHDVNRAAQRLMRLSLNSAAQASLIVRGRSLWAYAGQLPQPAAQELVQILLVQWQRSGGSDLARFVQLETNGSEHMLYATGLGSEFVLALVFDADMPFSEIRSQAAALARGMMRPPESENTAPIPPHNLPRVPIPTPLPIVPPAAPQNHLAPQAQPRAEIETETATEAQPQTPPLPEIAPQPLFTEAPPNIEIPRIHLEPATAALYNLSYVCVLLPRLPNHYLTGDLATRLSEWIQQLCIAFGWRLEHISVRPDHLQWIVNVPPVTSPSYLMRIMRQHTSKRVFGEFPRIAEENPSGDFWAPGYLIMGSSQPAPAQLLKDFIQQTRSRQGVLGDS